MKPKLRLISFSSIGAAMLMVLCGSAVQGDINQGGRVAVSELAILLKKSALAADIDHNAGVRISDLSVLLARWGTSQPGSATPISTPWASINVQNFGAKGDGSTDDTAAIQQALDAGASQNLPIYVPSGTYTVSGRHGAFRAILTYRSNTMVFGDGDSSVIKVKDNQVGKGDDYMILAPAAAGPTNNVVFRNFKLDGNGTKNLQPANVPILHAYGIYVDQGDNITIRDCLFRNLPGPSAIVLGNNTSPASTSNAKIVNNRFHGSGAGIPGNRNLDDTSTIYTQTEGGLVKGNRLWNDSPINPNSPNTIVVTALEIHGSRTLVANNYIENYTAGGNAVSTVIDSIGNTWQDNNFRNISNLGINIWAKSPFVHSDLTIRNNSIQMHGGFGSEIAGIYQDHNAASTTTVVRALAINDNAIYFDDTTSRSAVNHGIRLTAISGATIARNYIKNFQGDGINIEPHYSLDLPVRDVDIADNTIEDVGRTALVNRLWAVHINWNIADRTISRVNIHGNQIRKYTSLNMQSIRIEGAGTIQDVTVSPDNVFSGDETTGGMPASRR